MPSHLPQQPISRSAARLILLGVLLLAAWSRWQAIDLVEFKFDEANIAGIAMRIAGGDALPVLSGGTSLGLQRGALIPYLQAVPLALIGPEPEAAVWGMGALGLLAVALTYLLGRRVGGERTGLLAALFMAAHPWVVHYDRKLWAHILPLLSVALLLVAWEVVVRRRPRWAFWFPLLAALQLQAHVLALLQGLSWLGGFVIAPRRWLRRPLAWGLLIAFLLSTPYLWALGSRGVAALDRGERFWAGLAASVEDAAGRWSQGRDFMTGAGIHTLAGLEAATGRWWALNESLSWLLLLLLAVGAARLLTWLRQPSQRPAAALLLAWTLPPILTLGLAPVPVFPQYWSVLLPIPALLLALALDWPWRGRRQPVMSLIGGLMALIIVAVWVGSYVTVLDRVAAGAGGGSFGVPLRRWRAATTAARSEAARLGIEEVRVAVRGVDPGQQGDPAAVALLIGNPPWARFVAPSDPAALLLKSGQPSLYLWALADSQGARSLAAAGELLWQGNLAAGLPPARLYRLPPASALDLPLTPLQPPARFDAGLALTGYAYPAAPRPGQPLRVLLRWQVMDPRPETRQRDFTVFNHIIDASGGERVAQADGLALLSRDWWPGDVILQPYEVILPAGRYFWQTGLYSRSDGGRAGLEGGGDVLTLPPFSIP